MRTANAAGAGQRHRPGIRGHSPAGAGLALNWKRSPRVAAIAAIAIALAVGLGHVYVGTVTSVGPALVLAQPGDLVTIRILDTGARESTATMRSFTDTKVPPQAPGS